MTLPVSRRPHRRDTSLKMQDMVDPAGEEELPPGQKKWLCEYCTYENWPSTHKCSMCRGCKPVRVIGQAQTIYSATQASHDIYRLSPPPPRSSPDRKSVV